MQFGTAAVRNTGITVSILTRPEGRMQSRRLIDPPAMSKFQSSPGQKAGCNFALLRTPVTPMVFQSSPGQKAGCNLQQPSMPHGPDSVSILTRPEGRMQ